MKIRIQRQLFKPGEDFELAKQQQRPVSNDLLASMRADFRTDQCQMETSRRLPRPGERSLLQSSSLIQTVRPCRRCLEATRTLWPIAGLKRVYQQRADDRFVETAMETATVLAWPL